MTNSKWDTLIGEFRPVFEGVCSVHSLRPPLSSGHSEEGEQGPSHVVVVEIVLLPLPPLSFYFIFIVYQVLAPEETHTQGL